MAIDTSAKTRVIGQELALLVVPGNGEAIQTLTRMHEPMLGEIHIIAITPKEPKQCLVRVAGETEEIERFLSLIQADGLEILEMYRSKRVTIRFPHTFP